MIEKFKKEDSTLAQKLLVTWNDKRKEIEALETEMKEIERQICETFPRFKIGDILREVESGKRHVIKKIRVSEWQLKGGFGGEPQIEFEYTTHPIRKDGQPSLNSSTIWSNIVVEPTGEHIDLNKNI